MKKVVWLLLDNRMGSVGQALGVGQALDKNLFELVEKKIVYNFFAALPNYLKGASLLGVVAESKKELQAPYPDLVISASRRTACVARYIKKKSKGHTKIVQILHPGTELEDFDLIFLPEHDSHKKSNENTFFVVGCPHRVTDDVLATAKEKWQEQFASLPKPLTALIIGGSIKKAPFSLANAQALAEKTAAFMRQTKGALLIADSKRTGRESRDLIVSHLKDFPSHMFLWGSEGENPYLGYLACADNIIVTGDSVSMCSEACGTGKPVYVFAGENWLTNKHYRFIHSLFKEHYATELAEGIKDFKPKSTLNSGKEIAQKIHEAMF
ncbi:MAG: mitochondrial fission ELM1 family protein [Alphaproteobacteria bacterium]|nr:mitochondrial fission ELM1 family protein [Alphaproteobacteria bacterium]